MKKNKNSQHQQQNEHADTQALKADRTKKAAKKVGRYSLAVGVGAWGALTGQEIVNNHVSRTEQAQIIAVDITSKIAGKEPLSVLKGGEAVIELESGNVQRIANPIITDDNMVAERGNFMQEEGNPIVSVYGAGVSTPSGDKVKNVNYIKHGTLRGDIYHWDGVNDLKPKQGFDSFGEAFGASSRVEISVPTAVHELEPKYLDRSNMMEIPPPPSQLNRETPDYFLSKSSGEQELARGISQPPY